MSDTTNKQLVKEIKKLSGAEAERRFPGIGGLVLTLYAKRANRTKLLYEWVREGTVTLPEFDRLLKIIAYVDEMLELPATG